MVERLDLRNVAITSVLACTVVAGLEHASHVVLVTTGVTALTAGLAFARQALRQWRLTRGLLAVTRPGEVDGIDVQLGPLQGAAFVAGLTRPRIFWDDGLASTLTAEEQRAVALHEDAHRIARDPLRMALLSIVAPAARRLPAGAAWLERQAASREIAADRDALSRGASGPAIASALLKVRPVDPAVVTGFAPAVDLRLRALLDGAPPAPRHWRSTLAGLGLSASGCLLMVLHRLPSVLAAICC